MTEQKIREAFEKRVPDSFRDGYPLQYDAAKAHFEAGYLAAAAEYQCAAKEQS